MLLSYLFGCRRTTYNVTRRSKGIHTSSQTLDVHPGPCAGCKLSFGIDSFRLSGWSDRRKRYPYPVFVLDFLKGLGGVKISIAIATAMRPEWGSLEMFGVLAAASSVI